MADPRDATPDLGVGQRVESKGASPLCGFDVLRGLGPDLRAALEALLGATGRLEQTPLGHEQRDALGAAQRAGEDLARTLEELLLVADLRGEGTPTSRRVPLRDLVEGLVETQFAASRERGVRFVGRVDRALPQWVRADPVLLRSLLERLAELALPRARGGQLELAVGLASTDGWGEDGPAGRLRVTLSDARGPLSGRPFGPLTGVAPRRTPRTPSGLIDLLRAEACRLLVARLGGEARPGLLGEVCVELPFEGVEDPLGGPDAARAPLASRRALVLALGEGPRRELSQLLEELGAEPVVAKSLAEALDWLRSGAPCDLLVTDVDLGSRATDALARGVLERAPSARPRWLLLVPEAPGPAVAAAWLRAGIDAWLQRPLRRDRLRRVATLCLADAPTEGLRERENAFGGSLRGDEGGERGGARPSPGRAEGSPMFDPDSSEVLDRDVVASLVELGGEDEPELFQELVELFLREAPPRLADLQNALENDDAERLERVAHSLKSSSGNLGVRQLAELCIAIERLGREGDVESARALVERSAVEYERARTALEAYLS